MKKQKNQPKKKIYLEADSDGEMSVVEVSGTFEDLVYLISVAILEVPRFLEVIELAIDFNEYKKEKEKEEKKN